MRNAKSTSDSSAWLGHLMIEDGQELCPVSLPCSSLESNVWPRAETPLRWNDLD